MTAPCRLAKSDLTLPCKQMALYLLGKVLVRKLENGTLMKGRIVETECYLGAEDKASHSFNGRRTAKNEPMYMPSGTTYVYFTYGMYYCFNISSIEPGAAVLIRALQPLEGLELMEEFRKVKKKGLLKETDLCNGPSKLCMAMNMNDGMTVEEKEIVTSTRIGIASAGEEWAGKPLRFYVLGNPHVSKRDRKAEKELH